MKGVVVPLRRVAGEIAELSDEALVAACAVGEAAALGALFDRFQSVTYRFLSRLVGSQCEELDDLVQGTFLEVWRCAERFRGTSAVRTWVLGIAANLARHHVRGEQRKSAAIGALASVPKPNAADVAGSVERKELVGRLQAALDGLPADLRVAFVMCDLEETPGVEVARVLGLRPGTLWRRLHEARKALRGALEGGLP